MCIAHTQMNPYVSELALYDIQGTPGVAADISHINSKAKTKACLNGCCGHMWHRTLGAAAKWTFLLSGAACTCYPALHAAMKRIAFGMRHAKATARPGCGDTDPVGICVPSQGYAGDDQLAEAIKDADVIIIPAGVPRKPGMTRDDLFKVWARAHAR